MSIQATTGISVRCNLCLKNGPIVRYDNARYRNAGPNHPNAAYIVMIQAEAEKEARIEGFIKLNEPEAPRLPIPVDGDLNGDDVADNDHVVPARQRHVCPSCLEQLLDCVRARPTRPMGLGIPRVKANEQGKEKTRKRK